MIINSSKWHRKGMRYQFVIDYDYALQRGTVTVSYDWLTYHLVRWYHGEEAMQEQIEDRIDELKQELGDYEI